MTGRTAEQEARFQELLNAIHAEDEERAEGLIEGGSRKPRSFTREEIWAREEEYRRRCTGEVPFRPDPRDYPYRERGRGLRR